MVLKTGNKEGKDYRGWVCSSRNRDDQCPAKWMKVDESGKWVFKVRCVKCLRVASMTLAIMFYRSSNPDKPSGLYCEDCIDDES